MSDNGASLSMHQNRYGRFISHGEYDALHIENTALRKLWDSKPAPIADYAELVADAERYRWLRNVANSHDWERCGNITAEQGDVYIDAARKEGDK